MKRTSALACVLAATALAGCGGDDDGGDEAKAPSTSPAAVAATPVGQWADGLCTKISGTVKEVQPPEVNAKTPKGTQKSLAGFFTQVVDQLEAQQAVLEEAGPPPGGVAKADYERAVGGLETVSTEMKKVARRVERNDLGDAKDVTSFTKELGEQMQTLSSYQGPVVQLASLPELQGAFSASDACKGLVGA